jgi:hypothetical protein
MLVEVEMHLKEVSRPLDNDFADLDSRSFLAKIDTKLVLISS